MKKKDSSRARPAVSDILADGRSFELLYDPAEHRTAFAVWSAGEVTIAPDIALEAGGRIVPFGADNSLIHHEAVLLPSEPGEYGSEDELLADIRAFIRRFVELTEIFVEIAAHYVLLSWVHDAFNELPYHGGKTVGKFACD